MPSRSHSALRYAIIGAGPSGLAAAKNLRQHGIQVQVFEQQPDLGGVWNYRLPGGRVYASTHMISSKRCTEFPDFPMPQGWPPFPHHAQVLEYLRAYAEHFQLRPLVRFRTTVARLEPTPQGDGWLVWLDDGSQERFDGVVIANGHHRRPLWPEIPGTFTGVAFHSAYYKTPACFEGKRVLVVGGGNSGCDIAVEAASCARAVFHSTRRGYYYLPKFLFGIPIDRAGEWLHQLRLPLWARRNITRLLLWVAVGRLERYGLPRPDHKLFQSHPIINSQLLYAIGHGQVRPKPDVVRFEGPWIHFADGSRERVDVVVYATGYRLWFPFIDPEHLNVHEGRPWLWHHVFVPQWDNLFVAGMIQPDSGLFPLVHWQTQAIAWFVRRAAEGHPVAQRLRQWKKRVGPQYARGDFLPSQRHWIEVEHYGYARTLRRLVKRLARGR